MDREPQQELNPYAQPERRFGMLQATALNMSNMLGAGPFITIPALVMTMGERGASLMGGSRGALVLGLLVGSFLNVVIHRLPIMMQWDWRAQAR